MRGREVHAFVILAFAVYALLAGCGPKHAAPVPVKGTVSYRGQPGGVAGLTFWPQDLEGLRSIEVGCNTRGEFQFACPPGRYKVTATPQIFSGEHPDPTFPSAYTMPDHTPLEVIIPEAGLEMLPISIEGSG